MSGISSINGSIGGGSSILQSVRSRPDPAEKFKNLDSDGSGSLDKTELSELAKELSKMAGKTLDIDASITTYDSDGDGGLSQEETDAMMREVLGPPPGGGPGGPAGPSPEERFAELDGDGSGGLNLEELTTMASDFSEKTGQSLDVSEAISAYDSDGDGELSSEEMAVMMEELAPPPSGERGNGITAQQVSKAYLANNGQDQLNKFMELLEQLNNDIADDSSSGS